MIHVRKILGPQKMRVRGISGPQWLCPGWTGTTISMTYQFFISFQLPTSTYLYMNVCVLRCTSGHIPRYMGQTSNINKRCQLCIRVCFVEFASIEFYIGFLVYDHYYIITAHILFYHSCSIIPVSCPYLKPWVFPTWYHLLYIYLPLYACTHDTIFNAYLWFGFIDARVLI